MITKMVIVTIYKLRGAQRLSFLCACASGINGTIFKYFCNDKTMNNNESAALLTAIVLIFVFVLFCWLDLLHFLNTTLCISMVIVSLSCNEIHTQRMNVALCAMEIDWWV